MPTPTQKRDAVEKLIDILFFRKRFEKVGRWIDRRIFKIDVYELQGDEIVPASSMRTRVNINDVASWQQVYISFGVPLIVITLTNGQTLEMTDKSEQLLHILQNARPEKELPWCAV